jgi:hypothetical protein
VGDGIAEYIYRANLLSGAVNRGRVAKPHLSDQIESQPELGNIGVGGWSGAHGRLSQVQSC